jgi:transcriptional regulator with XRE-family HTH domain
MAGLSAREVAAHAGVSRSRIANLEGSISVRPEAAERVLAAIAELSAERHTEVHE